MLNPNPSPTKKSNTSSACFADWAVKVQMQPTSSPNERARAIPAIVRWK
jgi:hypothetical protein